jgi:lysyl-tRNA synthetase class 2
MTDTNTPQHDENHLIAERRQKLASLRAQGIAFPNDFIPEHRASSLHARFGEQDQASLASSAQPASVAGRMMLKRVMGKASFATLQDSTGRIQIYLERNSLGEDIYDAF